MSKVNYGKTKFQDNDGTLHETRTERIYLSGVSNEDFTKIAQAGGTKVYFEGVKKGIALSMDSGNEVLSSVKGLKGKEFMDGLSKAIVEKYGELGENARVDFTNTVYFKEGEKKTTEQPRVVLTGLNVEAFTKVAQDKGKDVYVEGIKSGIALSMDDKDIVLAAAKGTKGKEFYEKLEGAITEKFGIKFGGSEKDIADREEDPKVVEARKTLAEAGVETPGIDR